MLRPNSDKVSSKLDEKHRNIASKNTWELIARVSTSSIMKSSHAIRHGVVQAVNIPHIQVCPLFLKNCP
jgi:hypothetical protein